MTTILIFADCPLPARGATRCSVIGPQALDQCLERDEQGRPRLTVTLPNEDALESLARSLAVWLT